MSCTFRFDGNCRTQFRTRRPFFQVLIEQLHHGRDVRLAENERYRRHRAVHDHIRDIVEPARRQVSDDLGDRETKQRDGAGMLRRLFQHLPTDAFDVFWISVCRMEKKRQCFSQMLNLLLDKVGKRAPACARRLTFSEYNNSQIRLTFAPTSV